MRRMTRLLGIVPLGLALLLAACGGPKIDDANLALARGETEKAIEIYKELAEKDKNVMAMRQLGTIYMTGQGVPKDYAAAEVWFQEGVKNGDGMSGTMLESLRAMRDAESGGRATTTASGNGIATLAATAPAAARVAMPAAIPSTTRA
jgi:TPR repeat protein